MIYFKVSLYGALIKDWRSTFDVSGGHLPQMTFVKMVLFQLSPRVQPTQGGSQLKGDGKK